MLKLRISRIRRSSEVLLGSTYPLPLARHCMCKQLKRCSAICQLDVTRYSVGLIHTSQAQPNNILYLLIRSKSFSNGFAVNDLVMWTSHLSGSYQTHPSRDSLHLNLDGSTSCKSCMFLFYVVSTSFYEVSYTVSLKFSHFLNRYLDHNLFFGTIPKQIGSLRNLRVLDLSVNRLTGPIPSELGGLSSVSVM